MFVASFIYNVSSNILNEANLRKILTRFLHWGNPTGFSLWNFFLNAEGGQVHKHFD